MEKRRMLNRILSMVAIVATVVVVLFSSTVISEHLGHHCNDEEHCPVCSLILQCEQNIKTIGSGIVLAVAFVIAIMTMAEVTTGFDYQSVQTTLVSQKVRLDS